METIGLIAAMPSESKALLRCIKKWERTSIGSFRGIRFQLMDRDCHLITSGMGLKRTIDATRALIGATNPQLLISFGIAGAVKDDLAIGDVIVAENVSSLDEGMLGQSQTLASLSKAAWGAAAQDLQTEGAHLVAGTAITTRGSQLVLQSLDKMAYPILEMETAGIAQVAAEMKIPLVSIRSVSDSPQAPIPFDLEEVLDDKYNFRIGKMLLLVLRSPQIIFQSRKMMLNSRIASDHAARAVVAALNQPSPVIST
ncbi:hypothetical protein ACFLXB_08220 [Chloroflexota bacterium]